jgi:hypothetical protein
MGCYFDNEKHKSSELLTFKVSKTAAWFRTAVNQNNRSRYQARLVYRGLYTNLGYQVLYYRPFPILKTTLRLF